MHPQCRNTKKGSSQAGRTTRDMRQIFHSRSNRTGIIMLSGNNIYRDTKEKQPHPISAAVKTVMHDDKSVHNISEFLLFATCLPIQSGCISQYRFFHSDA